LDDITGPQPIDFVILAARPKYKFDTKIVDLRQAQRLKKCATPEQVSTFQSGHGKSLRFPIDRFGSKTGGCYYDVWIREVTGHHPLSPFTAGTLTI